MKEAAAWGIARMRGSMVHASLRRMKAGFQVPTDGEEIWDTLGDEFFSFFSPKNMDWEGIWGTLGDALSSQLIIFMFCRSGSRPFGEKSNSHPKVHGDFLNQELLDLESLGYPKLPSNISGDGMILVNTFEETFGDMHGEGVWRKFGEKASNLNDNVVALASFNGEERFFACTGFFIEWNGSTIILTSASLVRNSSDENKIVENLRIEVLLKLNDQDQYREGTLEHYSLHYNVALVNIKDYSAPRPLKALLDCEEPDKVVAVGHCFKSGALMATCGELVSWSGTLDCDFLVRSTCKISKAGIGGPLVNFDGMSLA